MLDDRCQDRLDCRLDRAPAFGRGDHPCAHVGPTCGVDQMAEQIRAGFCNVLGGIDSTRFIHRVAAIGTFGYMIVHVLEVMIRAFIRGEKGMFWGPNSMVPRVTG